MPNHIFSEIRLHSVPLTEAMKLIADDTGKITFTKLLPLPLHFWPGSVGTKHEKAFPGTWLDAARATWGTKWDCYGDPEAKQDGEDTVIRFRTAWNTPRGWTVALFNTLNCQITVLWLDEGQTNAIREVYAPDMGKKFSMGPSWRQETIPAGTDEHRRLHKCLWGVEEFETEE